MKQLLMVSMVVVLFTKYDAIRVALIAGSLPQAQKAASEFAAATKGELAARATEVAKAPDLQKARIAFAALSEKMIEVRNATTGPRPSVYYCSMERKSWLQQKGKAGNPYGGKSMVTCGELKE